MAKIKISNAKQNATEHFKEVKINTINVRKYNDFVELDFNSDDELFVLKLDRNEFSNLQDKIKNL